jgi:hypothetical protein
MFHVGMVWAYSKALTKRADIYSRNKLTSNAILQAFKLLDCEYGSSTPHLNDKRAGRERSYQVCTSGRRERDMLASALGLRNIYVESY